MHSALFFKIFPPPKFLVMKHAGLDISDDTIHFIEYSNSMKGRTISKFAREEIPAGVIEDGDIKDEKKLSEILAEFDKRHDLSYVKVSLPEEKVYLFQTEVPNVDIKAIEHNIEFKLEENVPLSAPDAIFYFDLLPMNVTGTVSASVSVVPRVYLEKYTSILNKSGIYPIAYEVVPKSIARAVVPANSLETQLIVHIMNRKTGIYIVSGGVVCFTSTFAQGGNKSTSEAQSYVQSLSNEINRVYAYWASHNIAQAPIDYIVLAGKEALQYEDRLQNVVSGATVPVTISDVWRNAFNVDKYVPPISRSESLNYVVAAGLAL